MPIKLPEQPILTKEQLRQQYVDQHANVVAGVKAAIEELCVHHRKAYEDYLYERRIEAIQKFLDNRKPNQLICEGAATLIRSEAKRLAEMPEKKKYYNTGDYLRKLEGDAREALHWISQYTNHPVELMSLKDLPYFEQEKARDTNTKWISDENRPDFKVNWLKNGKAKIKAEVLEVVENAVQNFIRKTISKVVDILVAKGEYACELKKGQFSVGAFEGDIFITFPDKTGFRTHVILKTNYSVNGNPYAQYPLTFHEVVVKPGDKQVAMLSEDEICKAFGVKQWEAPPKQKKPWLAVKIGDIVVVNKKTFVCRALVLGTRGNMATVHYLDGVEEKIEGGEILEVLARTTCDTWCEHYVRVEPFEGKWFKIQSENTNYESGIKVENAMRVAHLDAIMKGL